MQRYWDRGSHKGGGGGTCPAVCSLGKGQEGNWYTEKGDKVPNRRPDLETARVARHCGTNSWEKKRQQIEETWRPETHKQTFLESSLGNRSERMGHLVISPVSPMRPETGCISVTAARSGSLRKT